MSQQFEFSDPGEGLQEAEVLEMHVSEGDQVKDGDTVLTVETDKANTEVPVPFSGKVTNIHVGEGDVVEVGDVLMEYEEDGGEEKGESKEASGAQSEREEKAESARKDRSESEEEEGKQEASREKETQESAEKRSEESSKEQPSKSESRSGKRGSSREPVPAAPSTRRLAREKGVDLHEVEPSGKNGRVTVEDVRAAAGESGGGKTRRSGRRSVATRLIPSGEPVQLPDLSQWGETERVPLRSIRRATAQNMARSWGQIPHVYHQDIADVTELNRFLGKHDENAREQGGKLTLTVAVMKALVSVLRQYPRFNASLDVENQEIVLKRYFHMGLAVATEQGLLVPVIRNVDQKSMLDLTVESADIAQQARDGELGRADMQGASITVTNPGPMGGSSLTPLINFPQVAILGMGQARMEPVVQGEADNYDIVPRLRLPLVLGFDHRVNDGADAAQFVTTLLRTLADPESLLLHV